MNCLSLNVRGARGVGKAGWVKGLRSSYGVDFIALQETKIADPTGWFLSQFWGISRYEAAVVNSEGNAGGLICWWDPLSFRMTDVIKTRHCLVVSGTLIHHDLIVNIANIHAPNDAVRRRELWVRLLQFRQQLSGCWVMLGDFNEVRTSDERMNSEFIPQYAATFNDFIREAELFEYNMGGHRFTYMGAGEKLSKLDRFFNSWLEFPGFANYVKFICDKFVFNGPADLALAAKLKWLKGRIRLWIAAERAKTDNRSTECKKIIESIDRTGETRSLSPNEIDVRLAAKKDLLEFDRLKSLDAKQKSRTRWAFDGDENSKFFHNVMRINTASNRIHGVKVGDVWEADPIVIKEKAVEFFASKFMNNTSHRPVFVCP
ncbi:uncharacterized protein LOC143569988 [Bidens hawaiensis]|uniref:uncharacterized protein LOC143569988 n=1 Tax=Bidens hawaiensis TaxID=980011 RepID=UPI00404B46C7